MTNRERIKDMMGYVEQFLENFISGYDVSDESFIIKYKDGTIIYVSENDEINFSKNLSKIDYIVARCGDDEWDTKGKSWFKDFAKENPEDLKSCEQWNEYINTMLY